MNKFENQKIENQDNISELNDEDIDQMSQHEPINYDSEQVKKLIVNFMQIDDEIRRKQLEIKNMKKNRKPCEDALLRFLIDTEQDNIMLGKAAEGQKIEKKTHQKKAPLKIGMITDAVKEELKKENLVDSDERCNRILEEILGLIDRKRPVTTKTSLKRHIPKPKKTT
jgi:hypothetical protein